MSIIDFSTPSIQGLSVFRTFRLVIETSKENFHNKKLVSFFSDENFQISKYVENNETNFSNYHAKHVNPWLLELSSISGNLHICYNRNGTFSK